MAIFMHFSTKIDASTVFSIQNYLYSTLWLRYDHMCVDHLQSAFFSKNINFRGRGRSESSHDYIMHPTTLKIGLDERELIGETFQSHILTLRIIIHIWEAKYHRIKSKLKIK